MHGSIFPDDRNISNSELSVQQWMNVRGRLSLCKHGMVHVPNTMQCYSTMQHGGYIVVRNLQQLHEDGVCISLCMYSAITSHAVIFSMAHDMSMLEGGD